MTCSLDHNTCFLIREHVRSLDDSNTALVFLAAEAVFVKTPLHFYIIPLFGSADGHNNPIPFPPLLICACVYISNEREEEKKLR